MASSVLIPIKARLFLAPDAEGLLPFADRYTSGANGGGTVPGKNRENWEADLRLVLRNHSNLLPISTPSSWVSPT